MELKLSIKLNEKLFLRDPETTELGRRILTHGLDLIYKLGFEAFTFKKLAEEIHTTEASIYRYFENKHRLLLYLVTCYWSYLEYQVIFNINNLSDPKTKIQKVIYLITHDLESSIGSINYDSKALFSIVINESNKAYLSKDVDENNTYQLFKPYKDLCARIAALFTEYNPKYPYSRSLASTVIEAAHFQSFFAQHLPRLTDAKGKDDNLTIQKFLGELVFAALAEPNFPQVQ